jgi:hypothetical protein
MSAAGQLGSDQPGEWMKSIDVVMGKRTKDGLCLVSNASKLGVGSLGDDYESVRQADEFVEVAHVGCPGLESVKGTEVSYWEVGNSP